MPDYLVGGAALALATGLPQAWKWQLGVLRACVYLLAVSMLIAVALTGVGRVLPLSGLTGIQADRPSGQFEVIDLSPEDTRWADFVAGQPGALPYHHPAWSQVLRETFGYRLAALGCTDATGRLTGVLPLVERKSLMAGMHLSLLLPLPVTAALGRLIYGCP